MSGDYSRIAFDSWLDDLGVLLEQGRPLTDRDWNDHALQLNRRIQAGTLDTLGPAVVPTETPDGFLVEVTAGVLTIGRGRMYVDGLLAENHGQPPSGGTLDWDARLAELFGSAPLDYTSQPYYKNPAPLPTAGTHLAYIDVWQREVTRYVRPDLVEPALGIDTSTRLQTVWQVKLLPLTDSAASCATPLDQFPGWLPSHAPSAGRLTVTTAPVPGQPDPCQVPPAGGYKGLENQLYRVEIHEGGAPGTATFKWSRDNASVEAVVTEIPSPTQIVVDSVGKDAVLRFSDGNWIEITDDWLELDGQPGVLRRIAIGGVDDATRTITLDEALPPGLFPVDGQNHPDAGRHTRIRRWDQKRKILDASGTEIQDLDASASDGTITVPTGATQVLLEHNIVVSFSVQPTAGLFRPGDFWVFAARSRDASVEELDQAPPRGIHHHYAKLAIVTFPDTEIDCRVKWPPSQPPAATDQCACTVCVTPQAHSSGTLTVQQAINQVLQQGGGTVCLEVGTYVLQQALQIQDAHSLRLVGKGLATRLQATLRVIDIGKSEDVTLESFAVSCRPTSTAPDAAIALSSSRDVTVERVAIRLENNQPSWSAVALAGALVGVTVRGSTVAAAIGIRSMDPTGGQTGLTDLRIEDNTFECTAAAVQLSGVSVHQFISRVHGNRVTGCQNAGIELTGATVPGFGFEISGNVLAVGGSGIVSALDGTRVLDNDIVHGDTAAGNQDGIRLQPGLVNDDRLNNVEVVGNRIVGSRGAAIRIVAPRVVALMVKQNQIERAGRGIAFEGSQQLDQIAIENNQLFQVETFGILAEGAAATIATTANQIETRGANPAVQLVFARGESVFSHNQCSRRAGAADAADVILGAGTVIAASNRIQASPLSMEVKAAEQHFTVLGNICRGRITVNGGPLPAPWTPLNLQSVS
jgi:hypothetical protein